MLKKRLASGYPSTVHQVLVEWVTIMSVLNFNLMICILFYKKNDLERKDLSA